MADEKKFSFIQRIDGIPHAWSKADELAVLIGDAKNKPEIARAACKCYSDSVANSILRALNDIA